MRLTIQQADIPEPVEIHDIGKRMALCFGPYAYPATIMEIEVRRGQVQVTFDVPGTEIAAFTD